MSGATGISFPLGYVPRDDRSYCASMAARIRALVTPHAEISAPGRQGVWRKFQQQARAQLGARATEAQVEAFATELRRMHMSALAKLPRSPRGSGGAKKAKQPLKTNSASQAGDTEPRTEPLTRTRSRNGKTKTAACKLTA